MDSMVNTRMGFKKERISLQDSDHSKWFVNIYDKSENDHI